MDLSYKNFAERRDLSKAINEYLETLPEGIRGEIEQVLAEAWYDPRQWAQQAGGLARGVYNMPSRVRAGFQGINPDDYGAGSVDLQNAIQAKKLGLDPSKYGGKDPLSGQARTWDNDAWGADKEKAQLAQMTPQQQAQYWQQKNQGEIGNYQQMSAAANAKNQYNQTQQSIQAQQGGAGKILGDIKGLSGKMRSGEASKALTDLVNALSKSLNITLPTTPLPTTP